MSHSLNWASANRTRRAARRGTLPAWWGTKVARRTIASPPRASRQLPYDEVARRLIARGRST